MRVAAASGTTAAGRMTRLSSLPRAVFGATSVVTFTASAAGASDLSLLWSEPPAHPAAQRPAVRVVGEAVERIDPPALVGPHRFGVVPANPPGLGIPQPGFGRRRVEQSRVVA